MVYGVLT